MAANDDRRVLSCTPCKAARYYVSHLSKVSLFYWLSESNGLASVPTPGMEGKQGTGERKPRNRKILQVSSAAQIVGTEAVTKVRETSFVGCYRTSISDNPPTP